MKDAGEISIHDYSYVLPENRIARYPLVRRDRSKLLVYKNGEIKDDIFHNVASHIPPGSLLVFNDTRVIEARLLFKKNTGGVIEIFCLEPGDDYADITTAMHQKGKVKWKCLVGGASKWKPGQVLEKKINDKIILKAAFAGKLPESFLIELSWTPSDLTLAEILHHAGDIPLPPYLKRNAEASDAERYQTVYANEEGSVAAPTAGLHFTPEILDELEKKNVQKEFVTLHVGAGTFKPVKNDIIADHEMHSEWIAVKKDTIENILSHSGNNIIAVGTTSLRTLESLFWIGTRILKGIEPEQGIQQWEPYQQDITGISTEDSLKAILDWMEKKKKDSFTSQTRIMIVPGYEFRIVTGLITNFHQPRSTLLLLIAAFIGNDWKAVYTHALNSDYRFLSYGDGSLLWR